MAQKIKSTEMADYKRIIEMCSSSEEPVLVTENDEAVLVVMNAKEYERITGRKLQEETQQEKDAREIRDALAELRKQYW